MGKFMGFYGWIGKVTSPLGCFLLLALRLYIGWQFFMAGKGKFAGIENVSGFFGTLGISFPLFSAYLVASVETVGGLLLLAGFFSRLAAIPLSITMIVAYLTAHAEALQTIFADPKKFIGEAPFLFLLTSLLVLSFGPGTFSLDRMLFGKKEACR